jgi:hypothetical protein
MLATVGVRPIPDCCPFVDLTIVEPTVRLQMKFTYILPLIGSLHLSGWAAPSEFPKDVAAFLSERESCDHWRGEPGYDDERQADINWSICQSCLGTDAKLAGLKKKYRSSKLVMEKLGEFEPQIESKDKAAAKRFCSGTRKPKWDMQ